ncbi:MAG: hypothetical protein GVY08_05850 [Bacteroidetes bacterium]|jgi:pheromone shutdown protein TraB|nr:hypothetical protein [Bacteroidota bacterium]
MSIFSFSTMQMYRGFWLYIFFSWQFQAADAWLAVVHLLSMLAGSFPTKIVTIFHGHLAGLVGFSVCDGQVQDLL